MKKMLIAALFVLLSGPMRPAHADSLVDQLYAGFVGRAKLSMETTTRGNLQPEFLVNYVEIGKVNGSFIGAVDAGVLGNLPADGKFHSANWTTGAKLHIAPLVKAYVHLPAEWEFMGALELDARVSYDWTARRDNIGVVLAYPFK